MHLLGQMILIVVKTKKKGLKNKTKQRENEMT